jgi:hypothetical protein
MNTDEHGFPWADRWYISSAIPSLSIRVRRITASTALMIAPSEWGELLAKAAVTIV